MQNLYNHPNCKDNSGHTKPENLLKIIEFDDSRGDGNQGNRHATGASYNPDMRDGTSFQFELNRVNQGFNQDDEPSGSYSPPTPPHTPQKNQYPGNQVNVKTDEITTSLQVPHGSTLDPQARKLSPLSISVDQAWMPLRVPERDQRNCMPPFEQPPPSPSVRLSFQFEEGIDPSHVEKKRDRLTKALTDILFDKDDENQSKPFALQDPPKPKLKRQLSTDSNDSVEVRAVIKSPSKRQSTTNSTISSVDREKELLDHYLDDIYRERVAFENFTQRQSSSQNTSCETRNNVSPKTPSYAQNLKWFVDKKSPKSESDFTAVELENIENVDNSKYIHHDTCDGSFPGRLSDTRITRQERGHHGHLHGSLSASHINTKVENGDTKLGLRHSFSCANIESTAHFHGNTTPDIVGNMSCNQKSALDFNHEMISSCNHRNEQAGGSTATVSSRSNPLVTEKGFIFPPKADLSTLNPISPRIVNANPFNAKHNQRRDNQLSSPKPQSSNDVQNDNFRQHNYTQNAGLRSLSYRDLGERFLRCNSDIERSPSKKEIEEIRECVNILYRSISDPSHSPQTKKNMLSEERLLQDPFLNESVKNSMLQSPTNLYGGYEMHSPSPNLYQLQHRDNIRSHVGMFTNHQAAEARRQLFTGTGYQQRQSGLPRFPGPNETSVIPDAIASILSSSNTLSDAEIQSINASRKSFRFNQTGNKNQQQHYLRYPTIVDAESSTVGSQNNYKGMMEKRFVQDQTCDKHQHQHDQPIQGCRHCTPRNLMCSDRGYAQLYSPRPSPEKYSVSAGDRDSRRNRKTGDIDLRVTCEEFQEKNRHLQEHFKEFQHSGKNCKCASVENEILLMARDAYRKIRCTDDSKQTLEQFDHEVQVTNNSIYDAMEILCSIKCLCKYGRLIDDIYPGSVIFTINCPTLKSLDDLWSRYTSKEIESNFRKDFNGLKKKYAFDFLLAVHISTEDYMQCRTELELKESLTPLDTSLSNSTLSNNSMSKSDTEICSIGSSKENNPALEYLKKSSLAVIHIRSQSAPITRVPTPVSSPSWMNKSPKSPIGRERKFSFSTNTDQSPRKAFQELNIAKDVPCSPTMKKLFEFDISLSPKTSPKRKTFAESPPWEHENHPQLVSPKRKNFGTSFPFRPENNNS